MAPQTYSNHVYRPVATGIGYVFVLVALSAFALHWANLGGPGLAALGLGGLIGATIVLLVISRTYITRLQDRIIRLEMQVRCATLLAREQQRLLSQLDIKQIAALRFAPDDELPALVERAARDAMRPDEIKRAIRNWVPDRHRT